MASNVPRATPLLEDLGSSLVRKSDIAYIEEMSTAMQRLGVPACVFQPETYLRHGYTEALLAKLLRPLQNYNDSVKLEYVLDIGIDHRHFNSCRRASAVQFYLFLEFLRTPAGQNALSLVSQKGQLTRRGGEHFTEQEMAWITMFEVQRNDLTRRLDDIRRDHKAAINDLDLQLCEALHQLETGLTQIKGKFLPAEIYTPLSDADFNKACWTEYTLKCRRQDELPVMISQASLHDAVLKFGEQVRQRHMLDYLKVGDRKQQLQDYIVRRSTDKNLSPWASVSLLKTKHHK